MLRQGRTGLGDDDFMLVEGSEDDNEKWAGAKVLGVMKSLAVLDAVVIASRWYAIPSYFSVSELAPIAWPKVDSETSCDPMTGMAAPCWVPFASPTSKTVPVRSATK